MLQGKQDLQVLSVGTDDGVTFLNYRVTTMTADVLASGGHFLFDLGREELGNMTCITQAIETFSFAGASIDVDSLSGAILGDQASATGGGTGFINFARKGALYGNAGVSSCAGSQADVRIMPLIENPASSETLFLC